MEIPVCVCLCGSAVNIFSSYNEQQRHCGVFNRLLADLN